MRFKQAGRVAESLFNQTSGDAGELDLRSALPRGLNLTGKRSGVEVNEAIGRRALCKLTEEVEGPVDERGPRRNEKSN
jgi:hypothetical protein